METHTRKGKDEESPTQDVKARGSTQDTREYAELSPAEQADAQREFRRAKRSYNSAETSSHDLA